jgi:hypothetical protein
LDVEGQTLSSLPVLCISSSNAMISEMLIGFQSQQEV